MFFSQKATPHPSKMTSYVFRQRGQMYFVFCRLLFSVVFTPPPPSLAPTCHPSTFKFLTTLYRQCGLAYPYDCTVKKGYLFSRPQLGCYLPNSPWESFVSDIPSRDRKIITNFYSVERFSGTQKEDDRGLLSIQSYLVPAIDFLTHSIRQGLLI
jgi:hypothetical protein